MNDSLLEQREAGKPLCAQNAGGNRPPHTEAPACAPGAEPPRKAPGAVAKPDDGSRFSRANRVTGKGRRNLPRLERCNPLCANGLSAVFDFTGVATRPWG